MGIMSDIRSYWEQQSMGSLRYRGSSSHRNASGAIYNRNSFAIASPDEKRSKAFARESVVAGFKAAAIAAVLSAMPVVVACRKIPWAKRNLNHTAQALIISSASISAFFITADKATLESARSNTHYDKTA
ncbi:unnamed protein product [Linum trigynum]|uniref:Early nodulin-93-like n=1 Tax=Linum trigynum TaxID=586398 RepID=A0AAV2CIT4_9ROSI